MTGPSGLIYPTAGEWLGLADRTEALAADLAGTDLAHWAGSLRLLAADMREEAGVEAEHEVEGDGAHGHVESRRAA